MESRWARVMAATYEPFLSLGERAGMRALRAALVGEAKGRVLEIGAGTGLNLGHYTEAVDELILTEPEEPMAKRLEARVRESGSAPTVVRATAEALPLPDHSVDTVVSTLVLCTVEDPGRAVAEIARVLRPDGRLLFIEHVRSERRWLGRVQDILVRPWRRFACNCHCNRRTLELLRQHGFELAELRVERWKRMPIVVRPLVLGRATPRAV